MRRVIQHLHTKSPHIRARIAFGVATGVTLVIALVWLTTLPTRIAGIAPAADTNTLSSAVAGVGAAFEEQTGDIQAGFQVLQGLQVVPNPDAGQTSTKLPENTY